MSLPQDSTSSSAAFCSMVSPSFIAMAMTRFAIVTFMGRLKRRSKQWFARVLTLADWRSLQMQMMGVDDDLMSLTRAWDPPRSLPLRPSISSMMTTRRRRFFDGGAAPFFAKDDDTTWQPKASPSVSSTVRADRVSDAFNSTTSKPRAAQSSAAMELLPMPGGPLRSAALAPGFSLAKAGFLRFFSSPRCTFSQSSSQPPSFLQTSPLPRMSFWLLGLWRSAQRPDTAAARGAAGAALGGLGFAPPAAATAAADSAAKASRASKPRSTATFFSSAAANLEPDSTRRPSSRSSPTTR
mmetsp:Transcript_5911/g.20209  ORF Transcript_5911/g.20209 Transcript_5911/m.20209 type:complete len:296 (+) Transcript_5911:1006-1893(+)